MKRKLGHSTKSNQNECCSIVLLYRYVDLVLPVMLNLKDRGNRTQNLN